jgi:FKBP-type peptidyl-prolyl cis-trans isomerase FklB
MRLKLILAALLLVFAAPVFAQDAAYNLSPASNKKFLDDYANKKGVIAMRSGLLYRVLKSGHGLPTSSGMDNVSVIYRGWLINGRVFDQTRPGRPVQFQPSGLIRGWTEALTHMREGDEWELAIPPNLAYGDRGAGNAIPPGQTLVFDLQLLTVTPAQP